ncbi:hypothetical protein MMC21_000962 [Puttea exsequens]|nr:hypothetical protein [Puttea exsequens]
MEDVMNNREIKHRALSWQELGVMAGLTSEKDDTTSAQGGAHLHHHPTITQSLLAPGLGFPQPGSTNTPRSTSREVRVDKEYALPLSVVSSSKKAAKNGTVYSPLSFHSPRRSSTGRRNYGALDTGGDDGDQDDKVVEFYDELQAEDLVKAPTSPLSFRNPTTKRSNRAGSSSAESTTPLSSKVQFHNENNEDSNESTFFLHQNQRNATGGRTCRRSAVLHHARSKEERNQTKKDNSKTRKSVMFSVERGGSGTKRSLSGSAQRKRRSSSSRNQSQSQSQSQDAVGGWRKLRRWFSGRGDEKAEEHAGDPP